MCAQEAEGKFPVRPRLARLHIGKPFDRPPYMRPSLAARLVRLTRVAGSNHPHTAAIGHCRETERGAYLHHTQVLSMFRGRKMHRTRNVGDQKYRNLAFLEMALQVDLLHSRRNVPVDAPEVFTGLVFAVRVELIAD